MIKKKKQEEGRRKENIKVWKNQTINLFFFFDEFGSKRTLLGILVVFGSFRLDLELVWFGFVVDLRLYGN